MYLLTLGVNKQTHIYYIPIKPLKSLTTPPFFFYSPPITSIPGSAPATHVYFIRLGFFVLLLNRVLLGFLRNWWIYSRYVFVYLHPESIAVQLHEAGVWGPPLGPRADPVAGFYRLEVCLLHSHLYYLMRWNS